MQVGGFEVPNGNTTHSGQNWWPHSPQMYSPMVMGCLTQENDTVGSPFGPGTPSREPSYPEVSAPRTGCLRHRPGAFGAAGQGGRFGVNWGRMLR